jgi:hypothetical protein
MPPSSQYLLFLRVPVLPDSADDPPAIRADR